ncbi:hypothetical protein EJ04DRAFT_409861, partial [Polyplosphaeria fusca]
DNDDDDTASECSTIRYAEVGHEPFETFQDKVICEAATLFPRQTATVTRIKGGSSNRIVGVTICPPAPRKFTWKWLQTQLRKTFGMQVKHQSQKLIMRIPRFESSAASMVPDIATLKLAAAKLETPVPEVLSWTASAENALGRAFMVQKQLSGQNLALIWDSLNLAQKKSAVRQVVALIKEVGNITSNSAGTVSTDHLHTEFDDAVKVDTFAVPALGFCVPMTFAKPNAMPGRPQSPADFLIFQCERWREYQGHCGRVHNKIWDGLVDVVEGLEYHGFISDEDGFYLCHGDLQGYNILVDIVNERTVRITGVIDWDDAFFAPKFEAFRAPFWTWVDSDKYAMDVEDTVNAPAVPELEELKKVFEEEAGEEFMCLAYAPEYLIARRLFAIVKNGIFSSYQLEEAKAIVQDWVALHP